MPSPGLLEAISGLTKEKIRQTIAQRETTHIEVLKECHLVKKEKSIEEIANSVLDIGLEADKWRKLNVEFVSVCRFVLGIDNPWVDDLHMLLNSVENEWKSLTERIREKELTPSEYYKGKPYEVWCGTPGCGKCGLCGGEEFHQNKIVEQIKAYFPIEESKPLSDSTLKGLQKCVQQLQNECNSCWINGEEFGGYLKGPKWEYPYVFGTEKMMRVIRKLMKGFEEGNTDCFDSGTVKEIEKNLKQLGFKFCYINVSDDRERMKITGIKDTEQILEALKELDNTPLKKCEIIRALTRYSVGILHWQNHCQATVTCVAENTVLAPAHIFEQDKSEIWDHFLLMFCKKILKSDQIEKEREKLNKVEEQLLHQLRQRKQESEKFLKETSEKIIESALDNIEELSQEEKKEITKSISEKVENNAAESLKLYCEEHFEFSREENEKKTQKKQLQLFCQLRQRRHNQVKEKGKFSMELFENFIMKPDLANIPDLEGRTDTEKTEVLEKMRDEIEKLAKIQDEDLVNLQPNEMRIHPGYTKDVHDHFRENCCRYCVDKVILVDHEHDFALLRIAESRNFRGNKEFNSPKLLPMAIGEKEIGKDHIYVAAHPFRKTLTIENFVKLLDKDEKDQFVENFHIHALMHAVSRNNDIILRHIPESLMERVPDCVYRHKYKEDEEDSETKCWIKRSYSEGEICHKPTGRKIQTNAKNQFFVHEGTDEFLEGTGEFRRVELTPELPPETEKKKLLVSTDILENGKWLGKSLKEYRHSCPPKRKSLLIPIPAAKVGAGKEKPESRKPYRMIITSRQEQTSIACEVTADGGKDGKGSLRLKKLDRTIVVVEKTGSVYLSTVCDSVKVHLKIKDGGFFIGSKYMEGKGKEELEKIREFNTEDDGGKQVYSLRLGETRHLCHVSFTLQKDSMGKVSLHYSCTEGKVQFGCDEFLLCLEEEELVKIVFKEKEKSVCANNYCKTVEISLPVHKTPIKGQCSLEKFKREESSDNDNKENQKMKRKGGRYLGEKRKESIRLERGNDDKWSVNILKRIKDMHSTNGKKANGKKKFTYYNLIVTKHGNTLEWKAEKQESRTWKLSDADQDLSYFVWPTDSLSSNFQLQFKGEKEESQVTLSFNTSSDKYRILQFDSNGKRDYKHLLRQVSTKSEPTVSGNLIFVGHARPEKISSADKTRRYVQSLNRSLSDDNLKKQIFTPNVKKEGEKRYLGSEMENDKFDHLKLIDMEYGASGGACCDLDDQGQLILHGMFLGACPSFYYNDEECKVFFHKTGTCINKILLSKYFIEKLRKKGFKIQESKIIQIQS